MNKMNINVSRGPVGSDCMETYQRKAGELKTMPWLDDEFQHEAIMESLKSAD